MRTLAYAKRVMERRRQGAEYWLAIVALGWLVDTKTLEGESGVARMGCPEDLDPLATDWRVLMGLDVLCVSFEPATPIFIQRALQAVWRARCATLWVADNRGFAERWYSYQSLRGQQEFVRYSARLRLDHGFRERVTSLRQTAFLLADPPLYSGIEFQPARADALSHAIAA